MKHVYSSPLINEILKGVLAYETTDNLTLGAFPFSFTHPSGNFHCDITLIIIVITTESQYYD